MSEGQVHPEARTGPSTGVVSVDLTPNGTSFPLPTDFFGVNTIVDAPITSNESQFLLATPARTLVWPSGGFADRYDPLTDTLYGHGPSVRPASNESGFIALCRAVQCRAIVQVPGEIDQPQYAAKIVWYTEHTLGFHPAYWEIGNEPALWRHFGLNWSQWLIGQTSSVTPVEYALEVQNYTSAMRAVDPTIQVLGLAGVGTGAAKEPQWLGAVAKQAGGDIAGFAIHAFPVGLGSPTETAATFLARLNGPGALPTRLLGDRAAILGNCSSCASLPIFITEIGSAVLNNDAPLVEGFPNAVFMGSEMIQALESNVSTADTFGIRFGDPGAWEDNNSDIRPVYTLFSSVLDRLGGAVQPLAPSPWEANLFALETLRSGTPRVRDLFVVNANTTSGFAIQPESIPGLSNGSAESFSWSSSTSAPVADYWPDGLPARWTVPPESLLLFELAEPPEYPVIANESGLPAGTSWFLTVGNATAMSSTNSVQFLLPAGEYAVIGQPRRSEPNSSRLVEYVEPNVSVSGPSFLTVRFSYQFPLHLLATPADAGVTAPASGFYNSTTVIQLGARAEAGYLFTGWEGTGFGSYTGAIPNATLALVDNTTEIAVFSLAGPTPPPPVRGSTTPPRPSLVALPPAAVAVPLAVLLIGCALALNYRRRREPARGPPKGRQTDKRRA